MRTFFKKILFRIFFKRIPKTQYGRCIECHANKLCGRPITAVKCRASMEQQYKKRFDIIKFLNS